MAGTVAKQVAYIEIDQATVAPLTVGTDVVGGTPSYGTAIRIPDIVEITATLEIKSVRREGDGRVKGVFAKVVAATGNIRHNSMPTDALAAMGVGSTAVTGTTPNQVRRYTVGANSTLEYFQLKGRAVHVDGIDGVAAGAILVIPKCKLTGNIPFSLGQEFAAVNTEFTAVGLESATDSDLLYFDVEETQTSILPA